MLTIHNLCTAILFSLSLLLPVGYAGPVAAETCLWEGKAPACNGECRPGYTLVERDKKGDGKTCITNAHPRNTIPITSRWTKPHS